MIIELSDKVRDLGVILEKELNSTDSMLMILAKKAFSAIRSIGRIRKYMSQSNLKRIVNVFVICRIVYCNMVFSMDFLRFSTKNYNGFRTSQLV